MNFNFFINTHTPENVAPSEQLASLGAVTGQGPGAMEPLPVEQLEAITGQGSTPLPGAGLAPISQETLASLEPEADIGAHAEPPLPVEQLEAMTSGVAGGVHGNEAAGLTPMPEEMLAALGSGAGSTETPMSIAELEAWTVGGGEEKPPSLAPLPVEELGLLDEAETPPMPDNLGGDKARQNRPKPPARARGKSKTGD